MARIEQSIDVDVPVHQAERHLDPPLRRRGRRVEGVVHKVPDDGGDIPAEVVVECRECRIGRDAQLDSELAREASARAER